MARPAIIIMATHLCVETTIVTIFATFAYAVAIYIRKQSIELVDVVIFAAVFGVVYFFAQRYFRKRAGKRK